jgi:hypothetical protein
VKKASSSLIVIEDSGHQFYTCWIMLSICIGEQDEMLLLSLASKLGSHPCTKAVLVAISTIP